MKRLLILACSATKSNKDGLLPAYLRYQGPAYKVLRRHPGPKDRQVLILSAQFGFIPHARRIPDYDLKMTRERALELAVDRRGRALLNHYLQRAQDVFVFGGQHYRNCVQLAADTGHRITFSHAGIGYQLQQLKQWLQREALDA